MQKNYDIIIVGSGIVGATAALALAQTTRLNIALLDAKKIPDTFALAECGARVSAISPASQRIFKRLRSWQGMAAKRVSPYRKMHVWDASSTGKMHIDCDAMQLPQLGHIIEDDVIRASLVESIKAFSNLDVIAPVQLAGLDVSAELATLTTGHGDVFSAKLIIAADGANSWLRAQAGITCKNHSYDHDALVATVQTSLPHQQTAWQRFLTSGPLAFLPLSDPHTSSIVWSTNPAHAQELLALNDEDFCLQLSNAINHQLGDVVAASPRLSFNLQMRHANNYIKPRLALVGDAAHTIHPLAGQGVNLGLLDVACLVEIIGQALPGNRDYGSVATLRRYERWRKAENATMLAFVDGIKYLFVNDNKIIQSVRSLGLNLTDKMQFIKHFFANYAAGNRFNLPQLASCQQADYSAKIAGLYK